MANYYTIGTLSPVLRGVPQDVIEALQLLNGGASGEEVEEFLEDEAPRGVLFRDLFQQASIIDAEGEWDEDILSAASEMSIVYDAAKDELYLEWEETMSEGTGELLQWLLLCLPQEVKYLRIDAANTCSSPRRDGFGGLCCIVTRTDIRWFYASTAAEQYLRGIEGTAQDPCAILEEVLREPRPLSGERLLHWFELTIDFVRAQGLDLELRQYLTQRVQST